MDIYEEVKVFTLILQNFSIGPVPSLSHEDKEDLKNQLAKLIYEASNIMTGI